MKKKVSLNKTTLKDLKIQSQIKAGVPGYTNRCGGTTNKTGNTGQETN